MRPLVKFTKIIASTFVACSQILYFFIRDRRSIFSLEIVDFAYENKSRGGFIEGPVQTSCFCRAELNCYLVRLQHGGKTTLIQTSCQSRTKFRIYWCLVTILLPPPRGNAISPKYINIIYEFCLARQKLDVWIAAVPEPCSTAALVELNCLPNLIQKFDSDALLLPCFCRT